MIHRDNAQPGALDPRSVRRRFDRAAATLDRADFVHRHTAKGLFERMAPMRLAPSRILDAGAGTGRESRALAKRYRRSRIVSLDASLPMLVRARGSRSRFARISELVADAGALPFAPASFDLVYANLLMPWLTDLPLFFANVARVLDREGLFAFATLGPASLEALRLAWDEDGDEEHVHRFPDMHDVGDALLAAGLRDPVLDVDFLHVNYRSTDSLFADLTRAGARNSLRRRRRGLTGKSRLAAAKARLPATDSEPLSLGLELVYGHAWGRGRNDHGAGGRHLPAGEIRIKATDIGRRPRQPE